MSAQAIGGAVGRNKIAIIVPCHRVIGANRNLTGYAAGIERKIKLLALETGMTNQQMKQHCAQLFPTLKRWRET